MIGPPNDGRSVQADKAKQWREVYERLLEGLKIDMVSMTPMGDFDEYLGRNPIVGSMLRAIAREMAGKA